MTCILFLAISILLSIIEIYKFSVLWCHVYFINDGGDVLRWLELVVPGAEKETEGGIPVDEFVAQLHGPPGALVAELASEQRDQCRFHILRDLCWKKNKYFFVNLKKKFMQFN